MSNTLVKQLYRETEKYAGQTVEISGWIRTLRASNAFGFIELNDGSFFKNIQIVFEQELDNFNEICKFPISASLSVEGVLTLTPEAKQLFEIRASRVTLIGSSNSDFPLHKKRHSYEYLRTIAHLRPRSNTFAAVFRVRSIVSYAIHKFFQERNFVYVHTPIITTSDCEGAGETFQVTTLDLNNPPLTEDGKVDYTKDFFGQQVNLTVSGQLSGETYALAFRDIYTFGPTFRAEKSTTTRHAAEFWQVEPEIAFAGLQEDMELAEDMVKYIINYAMKNAPEEMEFFNSFVDKGLFDRLHNVVSSDFGRVTYTEAIELLKKADVEFEYPVEWGIDLQTEHERYIAEKVYRKPVFVTDYPKDIKPFYMRLNDDGRTVAATDLLVPGVGEIIGAGAREERYDVLQKRIQELGTKQG